MAILDDDTLFIAGGWFRVIRNNRHFAKFRRRKSNLFFSLAP